MNKLFSLRPWQTFILSLIIFLLPSLGQIGIVLSYMTIGSIAYFLTNSLHEKMPENRRMPIALVSLAIFFVTLYLTVIALTIGGYNIDNNNYHEYGSTIYILIPLHLLVMASIFYIIYFISKCITVIDHIKKAKHNQHIALSNPIVNFIAVAIYFPLGLWYIQPLIREVFIDDIT